MNAVQTLINALVVGAVGLVLARMVHGLRSEIVSVRSELKADIGALRTELKAEIDTLRTELKAEIADLRAEVRMEIAALRSDLTQVALAVGAPRRAPNR